MPSRLTQLREAREAAQYESAVRKGEIGPEGALAIAVLASLVVCTLAALL